MVLMTVTGCAKPRAAEPPVASASPGPSSTARPTAEPDLAPLDRSAELERIEQNLLDLDFALRFHIESEGAVNSRIVGELRSQEDQLTLRASGSFAGKPVELSLEADGDRLRGKSGTAELDIPRPAELERAVVLGLTRMGLLHNLAMLVSARPPDHADGGVEAWLQPDRVVAGATVGPTEPSPATQRQTPQPISFRILVSGEHVGDATLWVDAAAELPLERHVVVRFPDGDMRVREIYTLETLPRAAG